MKVLFDMTYAPVENTAGIIIYAYRLLKGLCQIHKQNEIVLLLTEENVSISKYEYLREFEFVVIPLVHRKTTKIIPHLRGFIYQKILNNLILKHNITLFFSPSLFFFSLYTHQVPHIGVLHDAQAYILKKKQLLKRSIFRWRMNTLLNGLTHIITISDASKRSIKNEIHLIPEISVIYNSIDVDLKDARRETEGFLYEPYILCVNTLVPYKNIQTLIKAFALLKKEIKHNLVIKGTKTTYWVRTLEPLIRELGISERVVLIDENFDNDKMAMLYKKANLFVSSSLMEGFGFTPIEAAIYEIPVITSGIPALYETTLGLLTYYEPVTDYGILAKTIKKVLNTPLSLEEKKYIAARLKEKYSTVQQATGYYNLFIANKVRQHERLRAM